MDPGLIVLLVVWYAIFLFSIVCHEGAHAWVASRLGDPTAAGAGHASLDPVPHLRRSPVGMIVVPLISFFLNGGQWMIGWASVGYDPNWAIRRPKKAALMALAGPCTNLLLALVGFAGLKIGLAAGAFGAPDTLSLSRLVTVTGDAEFLPALATGLSVLFGLNLVLFVFNLMPVPPLDGSGLPPLLLDDDTARRYQRFIWTPGYQMIGLFIAWTLFRFLFSPVFSAVIVLLHPGVRYG